MFRFSLRRLFVAMTLTALACGLIDRVSIARGRMFQGVFVYLRCDEFHGVYSLAVYRWRNPDQPDQIVFYACPTSGQLPYAVVVESDGVVWFQSPNGFGGPSRRVWAF